MYNTDGQAPRLLNWLLLLLDSSWLLYKRYGDTVQDGS